MTRITCLLSAALAAAAPPAAAAAQQPRYDLLITGGTVVDGTGSPRLAADVAVRGDRIVAVSRSPLAPADAARVVDASGLVVAPGFIDLHAHLEPLLDMPDAESHVRQGVTTALGGPDGSSPWPIGPYLDSAQALGLGLNVGVLVGHNTIRSRVMRTAARAPTTDELQRMRAMVAQAMGEGAFGLSTGLAYVPGTYSRTDEVVALSRVAGDSGGIYTSHMRDEASGLLASVAETMEIGRLARLPVIITHHKAAGRPQWGLSVRTLAMVDSARRAGAEVWLDQYPYTGTQTGISYLVPAWALADGDSAFARRAADPVLRDSILRGIVHQIRVERGFEDLRFVQFANVSWSPTLQGRTLQDWAVERGLAPTPETGAELVVDAVLRGGARVVYHVLDEADVQRIMRHPAAMIASDGRLNRLGDGHPHPRAYGTFPRVLGRYARDLGVLTLEQAVHKMTGMPAARLRLADRGRVAEGAAADLVVFDPATVADRGTFEAPHQWPQGIRWVVVNGVIALEPAGPTGARGGRALRRPRR